MVSRNQNIRCENLLSCKQKSRRENLFFWGVGSTKHTTRLEAIFSNDCDTVLFTGKLEIQIGKNSNQQTSPPSGPIYML